MSWIARPVNTGLKLEKGNAKWSSLYFGAACNRAHPDRYQQLFFLLTMRLSRCPGIRQGS